MKDLAKGKQFIGTVSPGSVMFAYAILSKKTGVQNFWTIPYILTYAVSIFFFYKNTIRCLIIPICFYFSLLIPVSF